jgi:P-type conjugative transfer protein TrbJ
MRGQKSIAALTAAGVFCISFSVPQKAEATAFIAATEPTQILNNIALLEQYVQQGEQYVKQIQQYEQQIKDGQLLSVQLFGPVAQDILGLQKIVQGGQAIAYNQANLDQNFTVKFGGFGYAPSTNFPSNYKTWSQTSLDSTQHALDAANLQSSQLSTEQGLLTQLNQSAQSASGQMQAMQAASNIASEQIDQLMKLRQLMMSDMQSKAAFQASQTQIAASAASDATSFFQLQGGAAAGTGTAATPAAVPAATQSVIPITPR